LLQMFGVTSWFAAHLAAWRLAFTLMLDRYAELPTTNPTSCFICTAAAQGYPRLVRRELFLTTSGAAGCVNQQLRVLKACELLLAGVSPGSHRWCRIFYNAVGPRLAARLGHPLMASAAYLALKPAEYLAVLCLAVALGGDLRPVHGIYRSANQRRGPATMTPKQGVV
jgi:hypothetical protein